MDTATLTPLEARLLAALKALVTSLADADEEGLIEHAPQMAEARALIAELEPEPIPVGEAQDSDFGAFQGAAL